MRKDLFMITLIGPFSCHPPSPPPLLLACLAWFGLLVGEIKKKVSVCVCVCVLCINGEDMGKSLKCKFFSRTKPRWSLGCVFLLLLLLLLLLLVEKESRFCHLDDERDMLNGKKLLLDKPHTSKFRMCIWTYERFKYPLQIPHISPPTQPNLTEGERTANLSSTQKSVLKFIRSFMLYVLFLPFDSSSL